MKGSIVWQLLLPIPIVCGLSVLLAIMVLPAVMADNATQGAVESARQTVKQFQSMRAYYTRAVVAKVLAGSAMKTATNHADNPGTIPAPSTMVQDLSALLDDGGNAVRVYSPYPFPNRAGRQLDAFGTEAWAYLSSNPDGVMTRQETVDGRPTVRVAIADRMTDPSCVSCHNNNPGLAKRDWKLGDVRGVMEVDTNIDSALARDSRLTVNLLAGTTLMAVLLSLTSAVLARRISVPIRALTDTMRRLARGDAEVEIPVQARDDEVGTIAAAVAVFKGNLLHLRDQDAALRQANARFDAALSNMSLGLCLCDAENRVVVLNGRWCDIYGLAFDPAMIGMSFDALIRQAALAGTHPGYGMEDPDANAELRREPGTLLQDLRDGRTVTVSYQPMPDGGWIATYEDVTERRRSEAQVVFMARHDVLTGLPNRLLFNEKLEYALAEAGRGVGSAVLCLDLDRFKSVNDTLGHPVGDGLLRAVAERIRACVREVDTVARLGGDEFVVVQAGAGTPEEASRLARRMLQVVSAPYEVDGHHIVVGTSVGIALAPQDGSHPDKLLKNADTALYRAKADGRGTFRFFEAEMDARLQARRGLELDLRRALAAGEFELFYQPLIDIRLNEASGFEALLRWRHPQRGLVPPIEFISLAEEIGLIVPLGEWALQQACRDAASWPDGLKVAVNLSPVQFRGEGLVSVIAGALEDAGLEASRLELEITESVLLENNAATLATLHALRALGTRISLDDFGTGYSSLSYLRSFPFDKIKIDRSFVRDLTGSSDSACIVRAVTGLGNSLGISTTAEGVETAEQLAQLRIEGCSQVQGYLFSPPRPETDIPTMLLRAKMLLQEGRDERTSWDFRMFCPQEA